MGGRRRGRRKKKRRTIEIERETGTNVSFLRAVWRLPNFQSPSSNSATAIRLRPIRGQNFLSLFYLLLLLFFFFFILGWRVNPVKLRRRITRNIMPDNRGRRVLVRSDKKRDLSPRGISILHPADLSRKSCVSTGSRMKSSFESISRHFYFRRFVKFDIHSSSCWVDWKMTILR